MNVKTPTFLKWAGGKQQLLSQFSNYFPTNVDYYVEPFLGGGAVFFYILKYKHPKSARAFDSNKELINVYLQVKNNIDELIKQLEILENEHNNTNDPLKYYYSKRTEFNHLISNKRHLRKNDIKKAAIFIYLNKTCYNGLYRVNSLGEFNVPFNGCEKVNLFDKENLIEANNLIKDINFECKDFRDVKFYKKETIYFDPPYWPKKNGFISYTNPQFSQNSQILLANLFKKLHAKGYKSLILSNSDTQFIDQLYNEFNIFKINARRMINCNGNGRTKINEVLITNY
ncbi:Dam family site-specific DNA-(adenine-N6)-methyltransferase [Candidatus Woesearchaeota archaeon]|nr:Dam family site-specific DNA-(adenine-N6)-methyltransferase [Candidatus Woesearchaeota archaeon]MBI4156837.1 Dam family site-specific DNA-(adenine-N6)-methyltransferase [Candidatus Woesearchaeota archaeon]